MKFKFETLFSLFILISITIGLNAQEKSDTLSEITISADKDMYNACEIKLLKAQFNTLPASFQDPARTLLRFPGISVQNDQANGINYHGMPSEFVSWQLFGVDIINPNHLSNAGTFNDLSSFSSGGVNAISGAVINSFEFRANPNDIKDVNSSAGIADISLKDKIPSYFDANFIGFEGGYNHSWGKDKSCNTYLSGRYSFVGLLEKMGVDFGNEKINYQDFVFKTDIINNKNIKWNLFGLYGSSSNDLSHVENEEEWSSEKDAKDISYNSNISVYGSTFKWIGKNSIFDTKFIYSKRNDKYILRSFKEDILNAYYSRIDDLNEILLDYSRLYDKSNFSFGAKLISYPNIKTKLIVPFVSYETDVLESLKVKGGLNLKKVERFVIDYNLGFKWKPLAKLSLQSRFKKANTNYNGFQQPLSHDGLYFVTSLAYWESNYKVEISGYLNRLTNLAAVNEFGSLGKGIHGNALNGIFVDQDYQMTKNIHASIKGVDIYYLNEFNIGKTKASFSASMSLYQSKYFANEGPKYDSKYSAAKVMDVSISFFKNIDDNQKNIVFTTSMHYQGGVREPIFNGLEFDYQNGYLHQLGDYSRIDARIVYSFGRKENSFRHRISLDIQNLLNRQNDAYTYFDRVLRKAVVQKQLGLIPVISYRYNFL